MSEDPRAKRIVAAIRQIPDFPKPVCTGRRQTARMLNGWPCMR